MQPDETTPESGPEILDEKKATLQQLVPQPKDMLAYECDFGDSWHHRITVETMVSSDPTAYNVAFCGAGARACPSEDSGGPWVYDKLLKILRNPKHEEHDSMKEWLGHPLDPEVLDARMVNTCLRKLKWPRTTESQLRKVLMALDDYDE